MAKHVVTADCEYVPGYPFSLLEKRANDEVFVAPTPASATARGKLPRASQRAVYVSEFDAGDLTVCEEPPPPPDERQFAIAPGFMLRAPVIIPEEPPPDEVLITTQAIFINMTYQFSITNSATLDECLCSVTDFLLIAANGSVGGGSFERDLGPCAPDPADLFCTPSNVVPCLGIADQFSGRGLVDYVTTVTELGDPVTEIVWGINGTRSLVCNFGPFPGGFNCRQIIPANNISVRGPGVACSLPGQIGASAQSLTIVQLAATTLPADWQDSIDGDGEWFGREVIFA